MLFDSTILKDISDRDLKKQNILTFCWSAILLTLLNRFALGN